MVEVSESEYSDSDHYRGIEGKVEKEANDEGYYSRIKDEEEEGIEESTYQSRSDSFIIASRRSKSSKRS